MDDGLTLHALSTLYTVELALLWAVVAALAVLALLALVER